jgi:hypothetical protein
MDMEFMPCKSRIVLSFMGFQPSTFEVLINFYIEQFNTLLSHFERVCGLPGKMSRNKTPAPPSLRLSQTSPQMARILPLPFAILRRPLGLARWITNPLGYRMTVAVSIHTVGNLVWRR